MSEVGKIINYSKENSDLENAKLCDEFFYQSLSLCVIDAVFSIGVRYGVVRNVISRYCNYFELNKFRAEKKKIPEKSEQESIANLIDKLEKYGIDEFTEKIFDNRNLTSPNNGILKTEAVYKFSKTLNEFGVNYFQDIDKIINNCDFKAEIKKIPGQKSGISTNYFFMLAGYENYIKPDRMILRFLERILDVDQIDIKKAQSLLIEVSKRLKNEHSHITPRVLDYEIWSYEQDRNKK